MFNKVCRYILKLLEKTLTWNCFDRNAKKYKQDKKTGQTLIWQQIP